MRILIFTEGTILMHRNANGLKREQIVKQVREGEKFVKDYSSYVPIKNSVNKLNTWKNQGAEILYLTSRKTKSEINQIRRVLKKYNFPKGKLFHRKGSEEYKDVAEKAVPDILIEDDCESIGGISEMTFTHISKEFKKKIKLVCIKEFEGVDQLADSINKI